MPEYSLEFARSLLKAADGIPLGPTSTEDEQRAVLYLSLLSCEVTLKALLESAGHSIPYIRRLSHDLAALLREVGSCRVQNGGRWRSASGIRGLVANARFGNATVGRLLEAEKHGASKYPNNIRYGDLVKHFPASVMLDASKAVISWAQTHMDQIRK